MNNYNPYESDFVPNPSGLSEQNDILLVEMLRSLRTTPKIAPNRIDSYVQLHTDDAISEKETSIEGNGGGIVRRFHPKYKYPGTADKWIAGRSGKVHRPKEHLMIRPIKLHDSQQQMLCGSFALYDISSKRKLSEDFYFSLDSCAKTDADIASKCTNAIVSLPSSSDGKALIIKAYENEAVVSWSVLSIDTRGEVDIPMFPYKPSTLSQTLDQAKAILAKSVKNLKTIGQCSLNLWSDKHVPPNTLDPVFLPLKNSQSNAPLYKLLLSFSKPSPGLSLLFYMYPERLDTLFKQRNITIRAEMIHGNLSTQPLRCFFAPWGPDSFGTMASTHVSQGNIPLDEWKILLPYKLFENTIVRISLLSKQRVLATADLPIFRNNEILNDSVHQIMLKDSKGSSKGTLYIRSKNCSNAFPTDYRISNLLKETFSFRFKDTLDRSKPQERATQVLAELEEAPLSALQRSASGAMVFLWRTLGEINVFPQPRAFIFKVMDIYARRLSASRGMVQLKEFLINAIHGNFRHFKVTAELFSQHLRNTEHSHQLIESGWFWISVIGKGLKLVSNSNELYPLIHDITDLITSLLKNTQVSEASLRLSNALAVLVYDSENILSHEQIALLAHLYLNVDKPALLDSQTKFIRIILDSLTVPTTPPIAIKFVRSRLNTAPKLLASQLCDLMADVFCKADYSSEKISLSPFKGIISLTIEDIHDLPKPDQRKILVCLLAVCYQAPAALLTPHQKNLLQLLELSLDLFSMDKSNQGKNSILWERSPSHVLSEQALHDKVLERILGTLVKLEPGPDIIPLAVMILARSPDFLLVSVHELMAILLARGLTVEDHLQVTKLSYIHALRSEKAQEKSLDTLALLAGNQYPHDRHLHTFYEDSTLSIFSLTGETKENLVATVNGLREVSRTFKPSKFVKAMGRCSFQLLQVIADATALDELESKIRKGYKDTFELQFTLLQLSKKYVNMISMRRQFLSKLVAMHENRPSERAESLMLFQELSTSSEQRISIYQEIVEALFKAGRFSDCSELCETSLIPLLKHAKDFSQLAKIHSMAASCYEKLTIGVYTEPVFFRVLIDEEQFIFKGEGNDRTKARLKISEILSECYESVKIHDVHPCNRGNVSEFEYVVPSENCGGDLSDLTLVYNVVFVEHSFPSPSLKHSITKAVETHWSPLQSSLYLLKEFCKGMTTMRTETVERRNDFLKKMLDPANPRGLKAIKDTFLKKDDEVIYNEQEMKALKSMFDTCVSNIENALAHHGTTIQKALPDVKKDHETLGYRLQALKKSTH